MQDYTVILGGFEDVYMKKLALYLSGRMGDHARIGIAGSSVPETGGDTVWVGSKEFIDSVRAQSKEECCILLTEDPGDETAIYRYQSCEKLYHQIVRRCRQIHGEPEERLPGERQRWIVLTTDGSAASLLAFSLTCAQILGERGKVLYLNLSECSGMSELFLLEAGEDLSDLASALRKEEQVCLEAFVRQLEQTDYIMPPANPMILHELRCSDIDRLIQTVRQREEYDFVVCALGNSCCGCERIFRMARRIFHITQKDYLHACSQREWMEFISLCRGPGEVPVESLCLPKITVENSGIHLIHIWKEGTLGQLARIYLNGEANRNV